MKTGYLTKLEDAKINKMDTIRIQMTPHHYRCRFRDEYLPAMRRCQHTAHLLQRRSVVAVIMHFYVTRIERYMHLNRTDISVLTSDESAV